MKNVCLFFLLVSSVAFAKDPIALNENKKECFDPKAVVFQCTEGEEFQEWITGSCTDGLVEGGKCAQKCFDPKTVLFKCEDGLEFKGWNQGTCENNLVASGICE